MTLPTTDAEILLLHNPRCSKSRAALSLLEERGASFAVRLYLEDPLSPAELRSLATRLGCPASELVRRGESAFAESGCGPESGGEEIVAAIAAFPVLLERPILVRGDRAAIGRPPEKILALLR